MIWTAHLVTGALVASKIANPYLGIGASILSHFVLDTIPHQEYNIEGIRTKSWNQALPDLLKIAVDFSVGTGLIIYFTKFNLFLVIAGLASLIPDGLWFLYNFVWPNSKLLAEVHNLHENKIHRKIYESAPPKNVLLRKAFTAWKICGQLVIALVAVILLAG